MTRMRAGAQEHKKPAAKWRQKVKVPEEEPNEADTTVASEASGVGSAEVEAEVEVETTAEVEASTEAEAAEGDLEASVPDLPTSQEATDGDVDASTAEMTASQGPHMDFSNAAHLAFWLPLLSDHLVRSGYLTQCAVPPWSTQSQASGRRGWKARKAPAAEGSQPVGPDLLLQACWDHHSPGGCTRDTCRWQHFALDKWQSSWLRLQRFCFGAQLATFSSLGELKQAVEDAFSNEERLAANAPGNLFGALRSSLLGLKHLGYPFKAPVTSDGTDGTDDEEGDDCVAVGKGRAGLLKSVKALAGFTRPGCQVLPVGSFAWGIDIEGSDLDVVVATGKSESDSDVLTAICHKLQMLQAKGKAPRGLEAAHCVVYGVGTSMPVLAIRTFQDGEPLDVDMCTVGNLSSVRDAILFRHYFELLPRLPEVLQLLKRWLRLRALPTSSEGGYPQIFWMRLAARTFQTVGGPGEASAEQARDDVDPEVRQLLRGFCAQWSQSLPSWGSLMNLVGRVEGFKLYFGGETCASPFHEGRRESMFGGCAVWVGLSLRCTDTGSAIAFVAGAQDTLATGAWVGASTSVSFFEGASLLQRDAQDIDASSGQGDDVVSFFLVDVSLVGCWGNRYALGFLPALLSLVPVGMLLCALAAAMALVAPGERRSWDFFLYHLGAFAYVELLDGWLCCSLLVGGWSAGVLCWKLL
ncbi:CHLP [Symbiodinium sp. CCMP2592]|nr:CHLP [Symbiodinium sp. CCMP2592]